MHSATYALTCYIHLLPLVHSLSLSLQAVYSSVKSYLSAVWTHAMWYLITLLTDSPLTIKQQNSTFQWHASWQCCNNNTCNTKLTRLSHNTRAKQTVSAEQKDRLVHGNTICLKYIGQHITLADKSGDYYLVVPCLTQESSKQPTCLTQVDTSNFSCTHTHTIACNPTPCMYHHDKIN